jgi:uncharacterized protein YecE (DUF72 family)
VTLYVGTSGWAYPEWKPGFYPRDLPRARWLEFYAHTMTACEVNASFYRVDEGRTYARWAAVAPESFRFAAKAHRALTNVKSIAPDAERRGLLDAFLKALSVLGPRLGPVLFQFPRFRHHDPEGLAALLKALPPGGRYAFEFTSATWAKDEVYEQASAAGATVCAADTEGTVPETLPPGPFAYVRLRADRYRPAVRRAWLELLRDQARQRDVFAFTKHKGIAADDDLGGVGLAAWLVKRAR